MTYISSQLHDIEEIFSYLSNVIRIEILLKYSVIISITGKPVTQEAV